VRVDYSTLRELLESTTARLAGKESRILMVGCGNSKLSEDMYLDGYHNIVNIDISVSCIEMMRQRCEEQQMHMRWVAGDATNMVEFTDASFDLVVDKVRLRCRSSSTSIDRQEIMESLRHRRV